MWWRMLLWVLLGLALAVSPVALSEIAKQYAAPELIYGPEPWPTQVAEGLFQAHLAVSVIAAVAVFWLTRSWHGRAAAWLAIMAVLGVTFVLYCGAAMATTGWYW